MSAARAAAVTAAGVLPFSTAATNILLAAAVLAWLVSGCVPELVRRCARNPVAAGAALACCFILLGTLWADVPLADRLHGVADYRKLLLICLLIPLFDTPGRRASLLFAFLGGCLALLVVSVATFFHLGGLMSPHQMMQGAIVRRNHIAHGFIMAILLLAVVVLAVHERRRSLRLLEGAVAGLALINMVVMTKGRTGWVILVALLGMTAGLQFQWRKLVPICAGALLTSWAAYAFVPAVQERLAATSADFQELARGNTLTSIGIRLHFYQRGMEILADNPVLGAGAGSWKAEYERRSDNDPVPLRKQPGAGNPHSDYIAILVQFGAVGALLYIAAMVSLFIAASKLAVPDMWMARGLIVAYGAGAVFNSFLLDFTEGHIVALLVVALFGGSWPPARNGTPTLSLAHVAELLKRAGSRDGASGSRS